VGQDERRGGEDEVEGDGEGVGGSAGMVEEGW